MDRNRLTTAAKDNGLRLPATYAHVDMRMRVAMTLAYLAQEGGFIAVGALFGVAKSTVVANVNEVMDILITISANTIHFPSSMVAPWANLSQEFEENDGFPDCRRCH